MPMLSMRLKMDGPNSSGCCGDDRQRVRCGVRGRINCYPSEPGFPRPAIEQITQTAIGRAVQRYLPNFVSAPGHVAADDTEDDERPQDRGDECRAARLL